MILYIQVILLEVQLLKKFKKSWLEPSDKITIKVSWP